MGGTQVARADKRTANMAPMSVTRDVSQRSCWLKADALCRGSQAGAHGAQGELCGPNAGGASVVRCTQSAGV